MNTDDFHFFLRVADLGTISAAAKEANIAVSVASQKITRLEHHLELRLFHRSTRRLTLTSEAKMLITQGRPLMDSFDRLTECLKQDDQKLSGHIHLSTSTTFGNHLLIKIIAAFLEIHPELQINVDMNDQNINLITQGIDLAIRIGNLQDSSLVAKRLCDNRRLLCASPDYLLKFGVPKSIDDLNFHCCILQNHQHGISDTWYFLNNVGRKTQIKVKGHFICNSGEAIRQACLNGMGISNHSYWHVQNDLDTGRLVQVLPHFTVEPSAIYAVIPNRNLVPNKVKQLIDFIENNLNKL